MENTHSLVDEPERKRLLEKSRRRWNDRCNIRMNLKEVGRENMDRINMSQNKVFYEYSNKSSDLINHDV
jgi:hypothetical protein